MLRLFVVSLLTFALSACSSAPVAFRASIDDAAVYDRTEVHELRPLTPDAAGNVTVVSMRGRSMTPGPFVTEHEMWVTGFPEVRDRCRTFDGNVLMRLRQLLGLPPAKPGDQAWFMTIRAKASDVFRPAPDPSTDTTYPCADPSAPTCGNEFPASATPEHRAWIASTTLGLHRWPGGYPWTHLGYTYDWGARGPGKYGASEYILRKGAAAEVLDVTRYDDYCR
jgi:hypothetical protein